MHIQSLTTNTMMRLLLTSVLLTALSVGYGQTTADFENFNLPLDSFLNDAGTEDAFFSGPVALPNRYDPQWGAWEHWAISTKTDASTPGYLNQYSCIAGGGADSTYTYTVSYAYTPSVVRLTNAVNGAVFSGAFICNSSYAYWSMKDGDAFSKRFGGETGDDPDFFKLTVKKYQNGALVDDPKIEFYLADYRFSNNAQDYIVKDWTYVPLNGLGIADSLNFELSSSDNGTFGMNTPAYFCLDQISIQGNTGTGVLMVDESVQVFPNPAVDQLFIDAGDAEVKQIVIYNAIGQALLEEAGADWVDVRTLEKGIYLASVKTSKGFRKLAFIKQ